MLARIGHELEFALLFVQAKSLCADPALEPERFSLKVTNLDQLAKFSFKNNPLILLPPGPGSAVEVSHLFVSLVEEELAELERTALNNDGIKI